MSVILEKASSLMEKSAVMRTLRAMYLTRLIDERCNKWVRQNKGATFHLSTQGHELIGCASGVALTRGKDWGLPYYRDRGFVVGLTDEVTDILGAFLTREVPHHSGGRMMPEHFSHKAYRIPCQSSVVGSQFLQAVGVAKGIQLKGLDEVVYVSAGDGATSQGDFHEALNFASLHRLGVIFVIQDNGWAISVPVCDQTTGGSIAPIGRGYAHLAVHEIDGCDYEAVAPALDAAVARGRSRAGPTLIVAKVPRMGAHSNSDDPSKYKTEEDIREDRARDPLPRFENWILKEGILSPQELAELYETCSKEFDQAAAMAEEAPFPDASTAADHVFRFVEIAEHLPPTAQESVVMVDAINHGLDEAMSKDPGVVLFGQDVAHGKGGVFGVTRQLTAKHGISRCFNTPLAESTIIGIATGMSAVEGMKPVVEIQFADYVWTGMNQLMNELASISYRSRGEWWSSVVVRLPYGGYIQGGPYHSQSIEAYLAHCPGLKIVIPSNAADAKALLKAAIADPNPVMFLEHKALYRQRVFCARPEPLEEAILPLGKAAVVREGTQATIVAWGITVVMAVEISDRLAKEGISIEVIDIRTVVPLDIDTILSSVQKTGKCLIAHEAVKTGGFGAEIAAQISEKAFEYLDAPLMRIGAKDCMVPYCKILEDAVLPQSADIERSIRKLIQY